METTFNNSTTRLSAAWEAIKLDEPKIRIRDAAKKLGVSEAELLATQVGQNVTVLSDKFSDMFLSMKAFGKVMSLTRNEGCVLEHKGTLQKISIHGDKPNQVATVIGPIEQRVFFSSWKFGFAVVQDSPRGVMRSVQYFDKGGDAVLKIFLQESSDLEAFNYFVDTFKSEHQEGTLKIEEFLPPTYSDQIDRQVFQHDWENMKDTHDFFGMLKKFKVHRLTALKLVDDKWAYQVDRHTARRILEVAAAEELPIMIFTGNKGNIQIHQGKVKTIRQMGDWLNVLDPEFNMHLNENIIDTAWVVHKNTVDGIVSALELFDANGEMITQFFGLRKPGLPQNQKWKSLVDTL
ncbi:hemin-degrading factor [Anditalea andensis]|uniref:Hemin receptor n=1 Tax=Anditalea andensis TaxID=1048983 RepID=A0A074KTD4_9BACT|nr:hemin-degrading factor [Anditalea andensis]KEO72144.1 hemin receptor [Anditalea andensis]